MLLSSIFHPLSPLLVLFFLFSSSREQQQQQNIRAAEIFASRRNRFFFLVFAFFAHRLMFIFYHQRSLLPHPSLYIAFIFYILFSSSLHYPTPNSATFHKKKTLAKYGNKKARRLHPTPFSILNILLAFRY